MKIKENIRHKNKTSLSMEMKSTFQYLGARIKFKFSKMCWVESLNFKCFYMIFRKKKIIISRYNANSARTLQII